VVWYDTTGRVEVRFAWAQRDPSVIRKELSAGSGSNRSIRQLKSLGASGGYVESYAQEDVVLQMGGDLLGILHRMSRGRTQSATHPT
jgi:hypothetical protein